MNIDIDARKHAEEALRRSEENFRTLFESMDEGYLLSEVIFDERDRAIDIQFLEANPAAIRLAGRDFTGQRMREIDPDYEEYWYEAYGRVALTGEPLRAEHYAEPHGRWFDFRLSRVGSAESRRVASVFQDITERKRAGAALANSEAQYRLLFEGIEDGFCVIEVLFDESDKPVDYKFLKVNPAFERQTGLSDAVGKTMLSMAPAHEPFWIETYGRIVRTGRTEKFDNRADALGRWYEVVATPVGEPGENQVAIVFRDVLQRRKAEEALRQSEERYRTLFESIDEGFCLVEYVDDPHRSLDFRFLEVNQAFERQSGLTNVVGKLNSEVGPDVADYWKETYAEVARTGVARRMENHHEPTDRWYDVFITRVGGEGSRQICMVFKDTTERKRAEAALLQSEARLAHDLEATQVLQDIGNKLISKPGVNGHFDELCEAARTLMRSDCASIQELDQASSRLKLVGQVGFHPDSAAFWEWVDAGVGSSCGRALAAGERVVVPDMDVFEADPADVRAYRRSGIVSVQSTPLVARNGQIVGMMSTHWHCRDAPAEADYRFFGILARLAADFIVRIRDEEALRESEEKFRTLFESIDEAFLINEMIRDDSGRAVDLRMLEANPSYTRQTGLGLDMVGKLGSEILPDLEPFWLETYDRVARTGIPERVENYNQDTDRWYSVHISAVVGKERQVAVVFDDISQRKRAEEVLRESEERQAFLLKLSDAVRPLANPAEIQGEVTRLLREKLNAGWCYYVDWDLNKKTGVVLRDSAREGLPSLAGTHDVSDVPEFLQLLANGATMVVRDYASYEQLSTRIRDQFTALGFRSMMVAPLVKEGRLIASLLVGDTDVRDWGANEEWLLAEAAERTWAATERAQSERALRESEERQVFLLELSDALRSAETADDIEQAAVELLGRKLGASRVFYATVDEGGETWSMKHDFSESASGGAGRFPMSDYQRRRMADWQAGKISRVTDSETDPYLSDEDRAAYAAFGARAAIGIPLVKRGRFAALMVINQKTAREWTEAEIALAKEAAERTWNEIERARAEANLRESEERQAVLLRLSDALRPLTDAADIQRTTTHLLGEYLQADRVMFAEVNGDQGAETGTIRGQFVRPPATPFAEHFEFDQFGAHIMAARYRGEPLIVSDVHTDPAYDTRERAAWEAFGVRAAIVAALAKGGRLVAEFGVHSSGPRNWTDAEVALVQEIAERTWDAAERARAEGALKESEGRYRSLFESMDEAYAVVDVVKDDEGKWCDFRFVEVNPAFLEHTNMPPPVGKTATELLGTPNPRWTELYGQALDTGKPLRVEESEPTLGLTFDLNIFTLDRAKNRVAVLFTNITERKQAEDALRDSERHANILLAELQHRVRNTLAVVRSISRRTAENSGSVEEMLAHFQGRLDAFSRVQAALTRSPDARVDLTALIEDELLAHAAREGEQVTISGPDVSLGARQAERISLAIHELTTNAVKHGAFVSDTGKVRISWEKVAGEGEPMLQLQWSESGVRVDPAAEVRTGFGMELLRNSLPYDLQAETEVELRPQGLRFELRMPLEGVG